MITGSQKQTRPIKPSSIVSHGIWLGSASTTSNNEVMISPTPISIRQIVSTIVTDLRLVGVYVSFVLFIVLILIASVYFLYDPSGR